MHVRNINVISRFTRKHSKARPPMADWLAKAQAADWEGFADVLKTFNNASYVRPFVIFNVGGNNYRLQSTVDYAAKTVALLRAGTHDEYSKWKL